MDICRVCHNLDRITGTRPCYCDSVIKEEETMPTIFICHHRFSPRLFCGGGYSRSLGLSRQPWCPQSPEKQEVSGRE